MFSPDDFTYLHVAVGMCILSEAQPELEHSPCSPQLEKVCAQQQRTSQTKLNNFLKD